MNTRDMANGTRGSNTKVITRIRTAAVQTRIMEIITRAVTISNPVRVVTTREADTTRAATTRAGDTTKVEVTIRVEATIRAEDTIREVAIIKEEGKVHPLRVTGIIMELSVILTKTGVTI